MNNRIKLYLNEICLGVWKHRRDAMDDLPHIPLSEWRKIIVQEVWKSQQEKN